MIDIHCHLLICLCYFFAEDSRRKQTTMTQLIFVPFISQRTESLHFISQLMNRCYRSHHHVLWYYSYNTGSDHSLLLPDDSWSSCGSCCGIYVTPHDTAGVTHPGDSVRMTNMMSPLSTTSYQIRRKWWLCSNMQREDNKQKNICQEEKNSVDYITI